MQENNKYYIYIDGKSVEVSEEVYSAFYKMERRERYLDERDRENGLLYYDSFDNETTSGEEYISDTASINMEDQLIAEELHDLLHRCIKALPKADRELIKAIYFEQKSERSYGKDIGLSQNSINYHHERILSKLKSLMNILGSF